MEVEQRNRRSISASGACEVDRLGGLERARSRVVFDEFEAIVELLRVRVCERITAGIPQSRWQAGVAGEVAAAMRISPHAAARMITRATALHKHLPATRDRLRDGDLSPEAVNVIIAGLSHLADHLQSQADHLLCGPDFTAGGLGLRRLQDLVQRTAYELDAQATLEKIASAEKDRHVSIRPLPDCMARVSVVLPVAKAVGIFASLKTAADGVAGIGTELRTRAQVMADTAFERLTGLTHDTPQPVKVHLTISDTALLGDQPGHDSYATSCVEPRDNAAHEHGHEHGHDRSGAHLPGGAHLHGGGFLPTEIARNLVARASEAGAAWVRQLYIRPDTGAVVAMASSSRRFPDGLAELIAARDRYCRTPYCDAPIAHTDHIEPHATGGATALDNGQGLCATCNYTKQAPGWTAATVTDPSGRHTVDTRTPTGHVHRSTAPRIA